MRSFKRLPPRATAWPPLPRGVQGGFGPAPRRSAYSRCFSASVVQSINSFQRCNVKRSWSSRSKPLSVRAEIAGPFLQRNQEYQRFSGSINQSVPTFERASVYHPRRSCLGLSLSRPFPVLSRPLAMESIPRLGRGRPVLRFPIFLDKNQFLFYIIFIIIPDLLI
jgi:hypothetical protein